MVIKAMDDLMTNDSADSVEVHSIGSSNLETKWLQDAGRKIDRVGLGIFVRIDALESDPTRTDPEACRISPCCARMVTPYYPAPISGVQATQTWDREIRSVLLAKGKTEAGGKCHREKAG